MHYLLFYDVVGDYVARRAQFRQQHLQHARQALARGELVLAGALADPVDAAVLLFQGDSPRAAEDFARADPYVTNGLVTAWRVREWTTVVGEGSAAAVAGAFARSWSARATPEGADSYRSHFADEVLPRLRALPGQRGGVLLRRGVGPEVELVVLTFWDSMDAIQAFAGKAPAVAIVAPEARAVLKDYDREVRTFEVVLDERA